MFIFFTRREQSHATKTLNAYQAELICIQSAKKWTWCLLSNVTSRKTGGFARDELQTICCSDSKVSEGLCSNPSYERAVLVRQVLLFRLRSASTCAIQGRRLIKLFSVGDRRVNEHGLLVLWRLEKPPSRWHVVHHKLHVVWPAIEPCLRSEGLWLIAWALARQLYHSH